MGKIKPYQYGFVLSGNYCSYSLILKANLRSKFQFSSKRVLIYFKVNNIYYL